MNPRGLTVYINAVGAKLGGAKRLLTPFLTELRARNPEWELHAILDNDAQPISMEGVSFWRPRGSTAKWHMRDVGRFAGVQGADCLVNLTNFGPIHSIPPSILYQRNSLYYDRSWISRQPSSERANLALRRSAALLSLRAATAIVVPSMSMALALSEWTPRFMSKINVIPHGVDLSGFSYHGPTTTTSGKLLVVGHPAPHKGLDTAIKAIEILRREDSNYSLTLTVAPSGYIGKTISTYVGNLLSLTTELGQADAISFVGPQENVQGLYRGHDLMIAPSYTESFGFPILEAMATGIRIVATDIPAHRELLGSSGLYFQAGSPESLACRIRTGLSAPNSHSGDLRHRAENLSWASTASKMTTLVERVAATRRLATPGTTMLAPSSRRRSRLASPL